MAYILGIETSCDETAAAVFDTQQRRLLSNVIYSQTEMHKAYGGVVPEIASRAQLDRIDAVVTEGLVAAGMTLEQMNAIAVTSKPGLAGSLLIGFCFAKGLAWVHKKPFIAVNHLEGHLYSSLLAIDRTLRDDIPYPHLCLSVSGGHTALYLVTGPATYQILGQTIDDAGGEAFDKVAKMMGHPYPGGPIIENLAREIGFADFFNYPRVRLKDRPLDFSFSGLKTAVMYDMVKRGWFDLDAGKRTELLELHEQQRVASSLLICMTDIFIATITRAYKAYPMVRGLTFVGGVACNQFMRQQFATWCARRKLFFAAPPREFCMDNAGMIALVGARLFEEGVFASLTADIF